MSITNEFRGHDAVERLTPIRARIHSATTPDEVTQVQIDAFTDALADVAVSVAKRKLDQSREG